MPFAPLDLTGRTAVVIGGTSGIGARSRTASPTPAPTSSPLPAAPIWSTRLRPRSSNSAAARCASPPMSPTPRRSRPPRRHRERLRQGRHHGELRRAHQARADTRSRRRRLGRDPRDQPHGHAARRPGVRPAHGGAALRPHHQHRVALSFVALFEVAAYARQQGCRGLPDQIARDRMGAARRVRERHCARVSSGPR